MNAHSKALAELVEYLTNLRAHYNETVHEKIDRWLTALSADAEPVAVVGRDFQLLWASGDPFAEHARKHGIKVGSMLYTHPRPVGKREALVDATAHLAGAASAYRKYARRHSSQGRAEVDAFFSTRVADMDAAVERARQALTSKPEKE